MIRPNKPSGKLLEDVQHRRFQEIIYDIEACLCHFQLV